MLAMAASSRLLHWVAGSEVGVEVKLSLIKKNAPNTTRGPPLVKDGLLSALTPVICMILQHYRFFTAEGGTVVSTRPLIRYGIPCIGKQCSTCSRETRPTRQRKTDTVQATGG